MLSHVVKTNLVSTALLFMRGVFGKIKHERRLLTTDKLSSYNANGVTVQQDLNEWKEKL